MLNDFIDMVEDLKKKCPGYLLSRFLIALEILKGQSLQSMHDFSYLGLKVNGLISGRG